MTAAARVHRLAWAAGERIFSIGGGFARAFASTPTRRASSMTEAKRDPAHGGDEASAARAALAEHTGHEGSAAPQLSGRGVLATWMISIFAHTVLFAIMFMVPWLSGAMLEPEALPIPETTLIGEVRPASLSPHDMPDLSEQTELSDPTESELQPKQFDQLADLAQAPDPELTVVGIGSGRADPSAFRLDGAGTGGAQFFKVGPSSGARRVVFVVDRSGSMTDTFEFVRSELKRSIGAFRRTQKFHVIFFSSGRPVENPPGRLVSAIASQKEALFKFIDERVYPGGSTDPGPAMMRAFECDPDIIYFLTDGEFDRSLLAKLNNANRDRRVRIFTIAYFNQQGAELLREIAREHRGEFRFVSEADLP